MSLMSRGVSCEEAAQAPLKHPGEEAKQVGALISVEAVGIERPEAEQPRALARTEVEAQCSFRADARRVFAVKVRRCAVEAAQRHGAGHDATAERDIGIDAAFG